MNRLIDHLCRSSLPNGVERTDGELLDSFLSREESAALESLIRRHGPMVWSVCRRVLRGHQDAEDAFQATFLVLVQKAGTLPDREMVGNWLYGVAHQTAVRMRGIAIQRGVRERQVTVMPEPITADEYLWNDLRPVLDEELSRLPSKYRLLIVLCDLEGHTRKEVAGRLSIPEGTVASRLATAREMLAKRLTGRGVIVSGSLLGTVLSTHAATAGVSAAVAATLRTAMLVTAGAGVGAIPPTVSNLITGVTNAMLATKIKTALSAVLVLGVLATGATALTYHTAAVDGKRPAAAKEEKPVDPPAVQRQPDEKKAFTTWGQEVDGLQAGLGFRPGEHRVYHPGETVTLAVRIRNVGKGNTKFSYSPGLFHEHPPSVTGSDGKPVDFKVVQPPLGSIPRKIEIEPAPGVVTDLCELKLVVGPAGKYQLRYDRAPDPGFNGLQSVNLLGKLDTGKLELEVQDADGDNLRAAGGAEARLKVFTLRQADAADLAKVLAPLFKDAKITAYPRTKSLVVLADAKTFELLTPLIERLDRPATPAAKPPAKEAGGAEPVLKRCSLRQADAADLAKVLAPLFKDAKITAYPRTKSLVVLADAKTFALLTPLIERLDRPADQEPVAVNDPKATFLKRREEAKFNFASSPKFDPRVFVYRDEPISGTIADHNTGAQEVVLDMGLKDGVRFGHAFQIGTAKSVEWVAVAKVMELEGNRCVAKVVSLSPGHALKSLKGLAAVASAPGPEKNKVTVETRVGKNVWQTESLENKIIRGLLDATGPNGRVLIVQEKDAVEGGAKRVYTPGELIRAYPRGTGGDVSFTGKEKPADKGHVAVRFEVKVVQDSPPIKAKPDGKEWVAGHAPGDVRLRPDDNRPDDKQVVFEHKEFAVVLTARVREQLTRTGVRDFEKHFAGKTVRVTGPVAFSNLMSDVGDTLLYDLVVDDVSQFEAVE